MYIYERDYSGVPHIKRNLKKPCLQCEDINGVETIANEDQKPHKFRLDCAECGRYSQWIGYSDSLLVQLNLL